jgi:asparagine synthase (glutamine-hydrolysing)
MRNQLLRDVDWASMAHSVEVRTPLVDIKLFEFVVRYLRYGYSFTKHDMANTANIPLSNSILDRPKTGFSVPVYKWLEGNKHKHKGVVSRQWSKMVYDNYLN